VPGGALHILKAERFPDLKVGDEKVTKHQIGIPETEVDDDASTVISHLGLAEHRDFDRLTCKHEELRDIDGRWNRKPIRSLIVAHHFQLFRNRKRPDLLFATGAGPIVRSAMRSLKGDDFLVEHEPVDIRELRKVLKAKKATTHGVFFSELKIAKVKSAMLYGEDVDQSEEYGRYDLAGTLSGIMFETVLGGAVEKFLVTKKRTVVVYRPRAERDLLELGVLVNNIIEAALPPAKGPRAS
jgi:hypothetical protein